MSLQLLGILAKLLWVLSGVQCLDELLNLEVCQQGLHVVGSSQSTYLGASDTDVEVVGVSGVVLLLNAASIFAEEFANCKEVFGRARAVTTQRSHLRVSK